MNTVTLGDAVHELAVLSGLTVAVAVLSLILRVIGRRTRRPTGGEGPWVRALTLVFVGAALTVCVLVVLLDAAVHVGWLR